MAKQQISKEESRQFVDRFSKDHEGCRVRLETSAAGGRDMNITAAGLPLLGVSFDGHADGLNVMLGDKPDHNFEHNISPWYRIALDGNDVLEIEGEDGSLTRVRCTTHARRADTESGLPAGGAGRRDEVGRSEVDLMSAPEGASGDARLQGEQSWGQGQRGAQGYEDSSSSELHPPGSGDED
jgi:hypothetical protein